MAGSETDTRSHAVPAQPWYECQPSGANLQDLWGAGNREGAEQSVDAGEGHLRDRLRDRTIRSRRRLEFLGIRLIGCGRASTMSCWKQPQTDTVAAGRKAQTDGGQAAEIPEATIEQVLSHMLTSGSLLLEEIDGDALIFLPRLRKAEEGIAAKIKALAQAPMIYPPIAFEKTVAWCQQRTGKTLAPSQRKALKRFWKTES